ncbi:hypothetical protein VNO77_14451 [Canavalia gladiata]|uniref:Uncharacterized protein n=1 Tax=Canavalia gladiata TaxID=3824 RepID=A0AAN9LYP9_CANGL
MSSRFWCLKGRIHLFWLDFAPLSREESLFGHHQETCFDGKVDYRQNQSSSLPLELVEGKTEWVGAETQLFSLSLRSVGLN